MSGHGGHHEEPVTLGDHLNQATSHFFNIFKEAIGVVDSIASGFGKAIMTIISGKRPTSGAHGGHDAGHGDAHGGEHAAAAHGENHGDSHSDAGHGDKHVKPELVDVPKHEAANDNAHGHEQKHAA
ncbi:MAG: hypothetical protein WC843_01475 [Candidatus Gracilibacteria bacterium]|jgi:hypothetical protein